MSKNNRNWVDDVLLHGVESMFERRPAPKKEPLSEVEVILQRIRERRNSRPRQEGDDG